MANIPEVNEASEKKVDLGTEIPSLGLRDGRPVNKKAIIVLVIVFVCISIVLFYVLYKVQNRNVDTVAAAPKMQTLATPPKKERFVPPLTQAAPPKPLQQTQTATVSLPDANYAGAIPLLSENGLGAPSSRGSSVAQSTKNSALSSTIAMSLGEKRSKMGGGLMVENEGAGAKTPAPLQSELAKKTGEGLGNVGGALAANMGYPLGGTGQTMLPNGVNLASMLPPTGGGLAAVSKSKGAIEAQMLSTDKNYLIPRGSNITCVLDSRLVSDLGGSASCTVNKNVYSMNGAYRLIPKGSRLLGAFRGGSGDNERLSVIWDRILTPEGIDVAISEAATDEMGSTGIPGNFDGHWGKKLSAALLVSLVGDFFKLSSAKYGPTQTITKTDAQGVKTVETSPYESIVVDTLSKIPEKIAAKTLALPDTITIPQGQLINVMTTRDIDFRQVKANL